MALWSQERQEQASRQKEATYNRLSIPDFSWRQYLKCFFISGHDDVLTHQRQRTDYYACLRCGREKVRFDLRS